VIEELGQLVIVPADVKDVNKEGGSKWESLT
jgi:hypothetical protein